MVKLCPIPAKDLKRFAKKLVRFSGSSCVIWGGRLNTKGYGEFWYQGRKVKAHRFWYAARYGDTKLPLGHTCSTRDCVEHTKPVTVQENNADVNRKRRRRK